MKRPIYFDFNATTPLDAAVREAMLPCLGEEFGNPSSIHQVGRRSRALLDEARERAARVIGSKPSEIIFTSGGTESVNLAIFGCARLRKHIGQHIVTSAVEHHAVLHSCDYLGRKEGFEVTVLPVDAEGRIVAQAVARAIRSDTILVSIMAANNEIGTIQPISEIGAICRQRGVLFHTDAVQWFGKQPFQGVQQFDADLVSVCGHKFHGPKGTGLLYARSPLLPDPILFGGGHENERRAGTENLAGIMGFVLALESFVQKPVFDSAKLSPLLQRLRQIIRSIEGIRIATPADNALPNTFAFTVAGTDSTALLAGLDLEGICASSGSACSAGSLEPSHVIAAMGFGDDLARALVRFSLGRSSTMEEVEYVGRVLPEVIARARRHCGTAVRASIS